MFDTVFLRLTQGEAPGVDMAHAIEDAFYNMGEPVGRLIDFNGVQYVTATLDGLKLVANKYSLKISNSLCKFYYGENYKTLGRRDTEAAIGKLSDVLSLPIDRAIVSRLDLGTNFVMKSPVEVYMEHLGELSRARRLAEPNGLYYTKSGGRLCFYDKNAEARHKRDQIPELYKDRFVLRYEARLQRRVASQMGCKEVTAAMLYDEAFYSRIVERWRDDYRAIDKIHNVTPNYCIMGTLKDFDKLARVALVEKLGGRQEALKRLQEAQKMGNITRRNAYAIRQAIEAAYAVDGVMTPSPIIDELSAKIDEAARYAR